MIRNWEWVKQIVCKTVARNIGAIRVHFTPYFTHLSDQIGVLPVPRMGNEMEVISITLILKSKLDSI